MEKRIAEINRKTEETSVIIKLNLDGEGVYKVSSGIPFFDHILNLFCAHGFFDLFAEIKGDIEVDFHHTVEDTGIALGEALNKALGSREGIKRYGYAITPMDESLAWVAIDLSKRAYLVYNICNLSDEHGGFNIYLAKEFFRAFSSAAGANIHINVPYGENRHHVIEAVFKSFGRAMSEAVSLDKRIKGVRSTKGIL